MSNKNQEVYIVQANRSAIGAFGGMLYGTKICSFISNDPPSSGHYVAPTQTKTHRLQLPYNPKGHYRPISQKFPSRKPWTISDL